MPWALLSGPSLALWKGVANIKLWNFSTIQSIYQSKHNIELTFNWKLVTSPCHFKWSSRSKSLDQCRSPSPLAALRNVFWREIGATLDIELPSPPTFFVKLCPVCSIKNRQVAFLFFGVCNVVALFQVLLTFHSRLAACIISVFLMKKTKSNIQETFPAFYLRSLTTSWWRSPGLSSLCTVPGILSNMQWRVLSFET